jgi:hypothetical protein
MATNCSGNSENISIIFECKDCDYKCYKKQHLRQHFNTTKHKSKAGNDVDNSGNNTDCNLCTCGKKYRDRTGLWKHKKKCYNDTVTTTTLDPETEPEESKNNDLITYLMNENKELKHMIMEVCKNSNSGNNNTINSHNKTFNLQVFLNEDCKDAMNITDFVDSIKFQLADLEHMGQVGYVDGISNIILKNLKALDITKRPVHCTDQKRETIYIKEGGVWAKEDEDNKNVRKLIKKVAFRNSKCLSLFKEKYPDCITSESKYSDTYSKIVIEAMGGGSKCNDYDSENKIIRKIAKMITIDKSNPLS